MMNKFIYVYLVLLFTYCYSLKSQSFSTTSGTLNIDVGTNYASCASPGTKSVSINVSGLSSLTSTLALGHINFSFGELDGGSGSLRISAYLRSPAGTCVNVFDGATPGLSTAYTGTLGVTMVSSTSCANTLNSANIPSSGNSTSLYQTGQYGIFSSGVNLTTTFSGQNPNGTWTLFFWESSADPVEFISATLVFGNPTVTDQTSVGDNCTNAVNWDGSPTCASTNTKTPSSNMPGWAGPGASTFGTFAGGATCAWNGSNDNDTWIRFTAQSNTVCVNVSGLDQTTQSIVVTDPNTDGDNNPCTGAGAGQYWQLVSCPRPAIYDATSGDDVSQNHCFTATPGQTYYLVVDGNGGAESPFFINGLLGTQIVLPIELVSFDYKCNNDNVQLNWATQSELNNDYFTVMASADANEWIEISKIKGAGNNNELKEYSYSVLSSYSNYKYFKLKQTDFDGKYTYSKIVYANCDDANPIDYYPNPFDDVLIIQLKHRDEALFKIYDNLGQLVYSGKLTKDANQIDLNSLAAGIYYLKLDSQKTYKLIKK